MHIVFLASLVLIAWVDFVCVLLLTCFFMSRPDLGWEYSCTPTWGGSTHVLLNVKKATGNIFFQSETTSYKIRAIIPI